MIYKFREIWKTVVIDGVEHPRYQVSNLGRVKCLDWGGYGKPRLCKLIVNSCGYAVVYIDGVPKRVHRLVSETFIPNPQNKKEVDHVDTNRRNNCVWNLRWATRKENCNNPLSRKNMSDNAAMLGKFGTEHNRSVTIVQLYLNGKFIKKWSAAREVERELGISNSHIIKCCRGKKKSAGGYRWMYYSDYAKLLRKRSLSEIKPLF